MAREDRKSRQREAELQNGSSPLGPVFQTQSLSAATTPSQARVFCFLQGPHGSFFPELAEALQHLGHYCFRIGFNISDEVEWANAAQYVPFRDPIELWPAAVRAIFLRSSVTDLVLYGDARPYHRMAIEAARESGIRVHFFEEGYLRPFWITYEREGVNGSSELMKIALDDIDRAVLPDDPVTEIPPARWGELNSHVRLSLAYHIRNHFRNQRYPHLHRHLPNTPVQDWLYVARRVFTWPIVQVRRRQRENRVLRMPEHYHLVLLQLGWDASMQRYSPFSTVSEVIETCMAAFAKGAPDTDRIVFKTHPLEDGREGLEASAALSAERHGVDPERVLFIEGGKLAALIDRARSIVTVNSTAAQQALWRGKPVKSLGEAIFAKPGIVSRQDLDAFFSDPQAPDPELYDVFRRFLTASSQIRGGFYRAEGRALAMAPAVSAMLADHGPYAPFLTGHRLATSWGKHGSGHEGGLGRKSPPVVHPAPDQPQ
ncbi:MAG: capsule biosynthesis protein CapA [Neomegalonema sp.]|nr:capsule biosynthesis protein CapA [Neomegalonema sp.]